MWTFVLQCRPNADHFEQKGPHVDLCHKMWTYLVTLIVSRTLYQQLGPVTRLTIILFLRNIGKD